MLRHNNRQTYEEAVLSCFEGYSKTESYADVTPMIGRITGILFTASSNVFWGLLFAEGAPFWIRLLQKVLPDISITSELEWLNAPSLKHISIAWMCATFVTLLYRIRRVHKQIFYERRALQQLTYVCANALSDAHNSGLAKEVCESFCEKVVPVFAIRARGNTIGAAIRLNVVNDEWHTIDRGGNLSKNRKEFTDPIKSDGKLLSTLFHRSMAGYDVFICNDVFKAHEIGALEVDRNSQNGFANEIKSMMISRVKVKDPKSNHRAMVGILYITSSKKNHFKAVDVDPMLAVTEILAISLANAFQGS